MSTAMTPRERLLAAVRRQPVDHVPCCVAFNPLTPVQRRGHRWQFPWSPEASRAEQIAYQVERLGLDQVVAVPADLCRPAPGVTSRIWRQGDVLHKAFSTPAGELHAAVRYNDMWPHGEDIPLESDFNIGHFVEPWVQNEADLACLMQVQQLRDDAEVLARLRADVEAARALAERHQLATLAHVGKGLTAGLQLFGAYPLCLLVMEQPGLVDAYLEHEHRISLQTIELLGGLGVDMVRRNGFYETADFYGPAMLERFLGLRLRSEADAAHAHGMAVSYTVHSGVMPILDHLAGLTADSVFGIDMAFPGVDLDRVRDRLGASKALWIGPSSTHHLWGGAEPTRAAVRQVFETFGRTGIILAPGVSAHSIMPWESTLAMLETWRELR